MTKILHFTLGPVQAFVGQARRIRDLWAGSFLLSWLSAQAMSEIRQRGGIIVFPVVEDDDGRPVDSLLMAVENKGGTPDIGSIPNRFKAQFDEVATLMISEVVEHVQGKWRDLAQHVYQEFISNVASKGNDTQAIWDEQISNFWEINWSLGEDDGTGKDGAWLDMRKNWRDHWPVEQGGDHCTLMGDWQEISGFVRSQQSKMQDNFWEALQTQENIGRLELRDGERLCAIALVKRFFPKLSISTGALEKTIGWVPGGSYKKVGNWPSTAYMAAIPWLTHINNNNPDALHEYAKEIEHVLDENDKQNFKRLSSERATSIHKLDTLNKKAISLDGNLFHIDALKNPRSTPLSNSVPNKPTIDPDKKNRDILVMALTKLGKETLAGNDAQPFYAFLLMDGDNMGKLLKTHRSYSKNISQALLRFTGVAEDIVRKHQGVLLYAGGDDVLAMVAMTDAIDCARELRKAYQKAFGEESVLIPYVRNFTISAAVVYAHFHTPLRTVLKQAHRSLDKIAKHQNHRNSLVLTVMKSENITAQWVGSFKKLAENITNLVAMVRDGKIFSASFFYNLGIRYPTLNNKAYVAACEEDKRALILAEYCKGRSNKTAQEREQSQQAVECLLNACGTQYGQESKVNLGGYLQLDGAYIARFIVDNGFNFGRNKGEP